MDFKAFKMDGLGNDFVIVDNRQKINNLTKDQMIKICDRNFIGCDQLIFIESDSSADASLRFFNSDGGESGACGNGTRCVADLISKEKNSNSIVLNTLSGKLKSQILEKKIVMTEIGKAKLEWNEIPLSKEVNTKNLNMKIIDTNNNEHLGGTAINVGNPHIVFFVKKIESCTARGPTARTRSTGRWGWAARGAGARTTRRPARRRWRRRARRARRCRRCSTEGIPTSVLRACGATPIHQALRERAA